MIVLFHHGLCSNYSSIAIVLVCTSLCTRLLCAGLVMIGVSFDSPLARAGVQKGAHESSRKYDFNSLVDKKRTRSRGRSTFQTLLVDSRIW